MKKEFNCQSIDNIAILSHTNKGYKDAYLVLMHAISEEDEKRIDDSIEENPTGRPMYHLDNKIIATGKNIYTYGTVNLKNKEDIDFINTLDIVNPDVMNSGNWIPSKFDYNKGIIESDEDGIVRWYQTWNNLKWFMYNYCRIGKPKRVIIYRARPEEYHVIYNTVFKPNKSSK